MRTHILLALVLVASVVAPLAAAKKTDSAHYTPTSVLGVCVSGTCDDVGVGYVIFDIPPRHRDIRIDVEDALDPLGFRQAGEYMLVDKNGNDMLNDWVPYCDPLGLADIDWVDAAEIHVTIKNGMLDHPCPTTPAAGGGEVVANFWK